MRTSGRVVLGFRGGCAYVGQRREPSRALLTKVRMREVTPDSRTRVRAVRRGFRDVAWVRVAAEGRDTLTIRNTSGHTESFNSSQMLVGDAVADEGSTSWVSVEAGRPYALPYSGGPSGSPLRRGQRVGIVVKSSGYAESLRAREHSVSLEGPALTLPAQPGREHVLLYRAMGEDLAYVVPQGLLNAGPDLDDPTWWPWLTYADDSGRDDPNLHRTVVMSDPDGAGPQSVQVRVRRTVRVNDLVVDGPPVTFASSEPGTRFVAVIPASAAGTVRLTATDVATTGPWQTYVPPVVCYRDCYYPGLSVGAGTLAVDGGLWAVKPHELQFAFAADATGSVTLQLTDVP